MIDFVQTGLALNASVHDERARKFFDRFVDDFRSFDGSTIATRYLSPYLAFHPDGTADVFRSSTETAAYFQRILDDYHAQGARPCSYADLAVVPLGRDCVLATVTWTLWSEAGVPVATWRESYNLWLRSGELAVFASTDHAS